MALLLYIVTALGLLALMHRFVCKVSIAAAALLFFVPFFFVGHALVTGRVYAPIDKVYLEEPFRTIAEEQRIVWGDNTVTSDIYSQMIPWRQAVRASYARGEWPLWNPSILCGDILAAAGQPAAYSPFTLLAILLPAALSFTFTAAITFLLAAAGAFAFARELGCRESAASIAAAGFAFSSGIALYVLWPLGLSWALFPLVLLATHRVATAPSVHAWGLLTTAFTLLLLAGHGESALHVVSLAAAYGLFEVLSVRRAVGRAASAAFAAGGAALLLSAIHLLPHLEALPQTAEYEIRQAFHGSVLFDPTPQVVASVVTNFFPFLHVRRWIDPALPAVKGETAAVGSLILALAIYALWRVRSRTTWFFAGVTVVGMAAHASWKPIGVVFSKLPLFNLTLNDRLAFGAAFALVLLAALGAEEMMRRDDRRAGAFTFLFVLVVLAAGTWWISRTVVLNPGPAEWGRYKILAELLFLAMAVLLLLFRMPMRAAIPAIVALLLVQRTMSEGRVHRSHPQRAAYPEMTLFAPLREAPRPFRIAAQGGAFTPNTSTLYDLEDVRGYEAMTFKRLHETYRLWCVPQPVFFNRVDDLAEPFLSMMNVRYAFANASTPTPPSWRLVARQGDATLLENTAALERAFIPRTVKLTPDRSYTIYEMDSVTDFRERAWIEAPGAVHERINGPGRVRIRRADASGYELEADMEGDGWIVVTSARWQGWRTYLDGRRVKSQAANAAFIGVYTPKGKHTIRLLYWPASFVNGRAISFATLFGIVVFAWSRRVVKPSSRRGDDDSEIRRLDDSTT